MLLQYHLFLWRLVIYLPQSISYIRGVFDWPSSGIRINELRSVNHMFWHLLHWNLLEIKYFDECRVRKQNKTFANYFSGKRVFYHALSMLSNRNLFITVNASFCRRIFFGLLSFCKQKRLFRCPNGTYVPLDNSPGTHALNCTACPQGNDTPRVLLKGVANCTAIWLKMFWEVRIDFIEPKTDWKISF